MKALIFDFDGVLIESEFAGNAQVARYLTEAGYPTTTEQAMARFMGLSGAAFTDAIERWINAPLPADFWEKRRAEDERIWAAGIDAVAGAVHFVRALPPGLPRAIASSSSTAWIARHLEHIGLADAFGPHLYSGKEHVARGKPNPDLYWHAADALGVPIAEAVIIEDSPVGATGALASGARVIGLSAATHCGPGHDAVLRELGVAEVVGDFATLARVLGISGN
ncbi:HAD family phosphatase [Sphingomonas sp.]|uniref:HAD family hydrolase n=1 Tax=Sphingomonas sp. TaxID=28214 RepID=UPI001E03354B|nr:HAD family phosphatase [Sphingomonas sp.]MBX9795497.1 HAD family phosphatase [Sphingomonas sp.]